MARSAHGCTDIVVWEWLEDSGQWIPYNAETTKEIEDEYQRGSNQNFVIKLSTLPYRHTEYEIDLSKWIQTNRQTTRQRFIQRNTYPATTAFASGWHWEWCKKSKTGAKHWTPYSVEASEEIESQDRNGRQSFKFHPRFNMNHKIDLIKKQQINISTGYEREIRRKTSSRKYPSEKDRRTGQHNGSIHASGPTPKPVSTGLSSSSTSLPQSSHNPASTSNHSGPSFKPSWNIPSGHRVGSGASTKVRKNRNSRAKSNSKPPIHSSVPSFPTAGGKGASPSRSLSSSPPPRSSSSSSPCSSTSGSKKVKKKKSTVPVSFPPCPPGGIPCNAQASSGPVPVSQVLKKFAKKVDVDPNSTDPCAICQSNLTEDSGFGNSKETLKLSLCQHVFHLECLDASYSHGVQDGSIICPTCTKMHGIKTGNQPDGQMIYSQISHQLPGFSGCGTIRVEYHISPGIQTANHPHPGKRFSTPAFPRIGYLPDNNDGRRVLLLLIEAWKRRLIFTVGQSTTSGMLDCVTWTSIHHKTELYTNRGHGYPDDTYLDRVTAELEAEGVTDETL